MPRSTLGIKPGISGDNSCMCGRYYVDDETAREIEKIVRQLDRRLLLKGEIYPSNKASVIVKDTGASILQQMEWGFHMNQGKSRIINARSESVLQKRTFSKSVMTRRCIIPARWFYEWDQDKNKVAFKPEKRTGLFMAGFWRYEKDVKNFVLITTQANASVRPIHERMPLILDLNDCEAWLSENNRYEGLLKSRPGIALEADGAYQQKLF